MKRVIIAVFCVVILAGSANAYGPCAYVGIYENEARTDDLFCGTGVVTVKVWINPSDNGVSVMQYRCGFMEPSAEDVVLCLGLEVNNPVIIFHAGDFWEGDGVQISCVCQMDWFWTSGITLYVAYTTCLNIAIEPHSEWGVREVGGCDPLKTLEPLLPINYFTLNHWFRCSVPVESRSWGAIKSLMNE